MQPSELDLQYVMAVRRLVHSTDREMRQLTPGELLLVGLVMDEDGLPVPQVDFERRVNAVGSTTSAPSKAEPMKVTVAASDNAEAVADQLRSAFVRPKVVYLPPTERRTG